MLGYRNSNGLAEAWHASTNQNVDVISSSIINYCDPENGRTIVRNTIKEILDNGTVIVQGAGNGFCAGCYFNGTEYKMIQHHCLRPLDFVSFSPPFPFSPTVDERVILVTGTTSGDSLTRRTYDTTLHQYVNTTYHYMPEISVCSPGYDTMGLKPTKMYHYDTTYLYDTAHAIRMVIDTTIVDNPYPFWHLFGGTSFAAPIVAGVASLIKSEDPWLSAGEIKAIIVDTSNTDRVKDAALYPGKVGNGRVNAFKALRSLDTLISNYEICNGIEEVWLTPKYVKDYIHICRGSSLRIKSTVYFRGSARIVVETGGKLIVDNGGLLTGPPEGLWKGVYAYSDPKNIQIPAYQSVTVVQDSGVIENAEIGIRAVTPGADDGISVPYGTLGQIMGVH